MNTGKQIEFLLAGIQTNQGEPLAGGLVYTYAAGTNTPVTIYEDAQLTRPLANPATLDAKGCLVAFANTNLKIIIRTAAGEMFAVYDNLEYGNIGVSTAEVGDIVITSNLSAAPGATVDLGGNRIQNVGTPVLGTDAANKEYVDGSFLAPRTANFNMGGNKIVNLADPTNAQDATTKAYVDARDIATKTAIYNDPWQGSTLNAGEKRIVNLADGINPTDAVTQKQLQDALLVQSSGRKKLMINGETFTLPPAKTIYVRGIGAGGGGGMCVFQSLPARHGRYMGGYGGCGAYWEGTITNMLSSDVVLQFTVPFGGIGARGVVNTGGGISSYSKATYASSAAMIKIISPVNQEIIRLYSGGPGHSYIPNSITLITSESHMGAIYKETGVSSSFSTLNPWFFYDNGYVDIRVFSSSFTTPGSPSAFLEEQEAYAGIAERIPAQFSALSVPPSTPFGSSLPIILAHPEQAAWLPYARVQTWSGYYVAFNPEATSYSYTYIMPLGVGGAPCLGTHYVSGSGSAFLGGTRGGDAAFIVEY